MVADLCPRSPTTSATTSTTRSPDRDVTNAGLPHASRLRHETTHQDPRRSNYPSPGSGQCGRETRTRTSDHPGCVPTVLSMFPCILFFRSLYKSVFFLCVSVCVSECMFCCVGFLCSQSFSAASPRRRGERDRQWKHAVFAPDSLSSAFQALLRWGLRTVGGALWRLILLSGLVRFL